MESCGRIPASGSVASFQLLLELRLRFPLPASAGTVFWGASTDGFSARNRDVAGCLPITWDPSPGKREAFLFFLLSLLLLVVLMLIVVM